MHQEKLAQHVLTIRPRIGEAHPGGLWMQCHAQYRSGPPFALRTRTSPTPLYRPGLRRQMTRKGPSMPKRTGEYLMGCNSSGIKCIQFPFPIFNSLKCSEYGNGNEVRGAQEGQEAASRRTSNGAGEERGQA